MANNAETKRLKEIKQSSPRKGVSLLYIEDCPLEPHEQLFSAEYWQAQQAIKGSAAGRGTTLFLSAPQGDFILRQYLRGGLPGKVLSDQFWFNSLENTRAWQEMHLLNKMVSQGLPVPDPVAARIVRSGPIYRNQILIKRIPEAQDIHKLLCQHELDNKTWHLVGKAIKRLHQHQVYHHDLNIKNIMLDKLNKVWLIDFDKCTERKGNDWKQQNIDRLLRSLKKEQGKMPDFHWTQENWETLLKGYDDQ